MSAAPPLRRRRSTLQALHELEADASHHLTGPFVPQTPLGSHRSHPSTPSLNSTPTGSGFTRPALPRLANHGYYMSRGLWDDIVTLRWMRIPSSSFKLLAIPLILHVGYTLLDFRGPNPFDAFIFLSHPVPGSSPADPRYAKGWLDIAFILYHIIVFSFVRQFLLLKVLFPLARRLGIRKQAKVDRFGEQGYAMLYWGTTSAFGVYIMAQLPTWWYRTESFWTRYPHWDMKPALKRYYLMQFSFWLQQLIIIALKIEKPRKDYKELCAHHLVTIWLIGWSYLINLTYIGNAVFVSMDIPDTFFAFSKLCNYLQLEKTKTISFVVFIGIWTYFRHWLNLVMLYSVWTDFNLIPASSRVWDPPNGAWLPPGMKYQIFVPILLLQFLNLFWYFLILRILVRALFGTKIDDDRSDGEDD